MKRDIASCASRDAHRASAATALSDPLSHARPEPPMPALVSTRIVGKSRFGPVPTDFVFTSDNAYALTVSFHQGNSVTEWVFARDLLSAALRGLDVAGHGDITVSTHGSEVVLSLHPNASPDDNLAIAYLRTQLEGFLDRTTALVPTGAERYNFDDELTALLLGNS